jgi:hypothetical protein
MLDPAHLEPLDGMDDRLKRAEEHFETIKSALRSYYASDAHIIRGHVDIKLGKVTHFDPMFVTRPEERFHTIIGELLHNLRSSLDHLAWALVEWHRGQTTPNTSFPICKTRPESNAQGVQPPPPLAGCTSPDVFAFLDRHQPYQLGTEFFQHGLWVLHRLAILDRHRHVVTHGATMMPMHVTLSNGLPREWEYDFTAKRISSDEFGAELDFGPDEPDPHVDCGGTLRIVVQEPGEDGLDNPDPVPLIDLLTNAHDETASAINEARELFFS